MRFSNFIILSIFIAASLLSLYRLGEPAMWDDEAHVALFARNFSQQHKWSAWDGRNLSGADRNGGYLNSDFTHVMPQLDYLVAATTIHFLGDSPYVLRAIFSLAGLCSLAVFLLWLRTELPNRKVVHAYALASLAFSVSFLLNIRTCRYYSLAILFICVAMLAYASFAKSRDWRWLILLAVSSTLLFYSSALVCGSFLFALAIRSLIFEARQFALRDWIYLTCSGILALLGILPYALTYVLGYMKSSREDIMESGKYIPWIEGKLTLLWWNIREANSCNLVPWILALVILIIILFARKGRFPDLPSMLLKFSVLFGGYILGISLLSPQPVQLTQIADVRYLIPILPAMAAAIGLCFALLHHHFTKYVGISALTFFLCTNLLGAWPTYWHFRWLLPAFLQEITSPYPTACSEIGKYLNDHASVDDQVFVLPEFIQKPLIFEIGSHVKFCGLLMDNTRLPLQKIEQLNPSLLISKTFPTWVVSAGMQPNLQNVLSYFSRPHPLGSQSVRMNYELVQILPVYWNQTQRPELPWHSFGPVKKFDSNSEAVYIFKGSLSFIE